MKTTKLSLSLIVAAALALPLASASAREVRHSGTFETPNGRTGSYQQTIGLQHGEYTRDASVTFNHGGTWNRDFSIDRSPGELSRTYSVGHDGRETTCEESITRTGRHDWTVDASRTGLHGGTRSWSVILNN